MKKYLIYLLLFVVLIACAKENDNEYFLNCNYTDDEISFIKENNIPKEEISKYNIYSSFQIKEYFVYEEIREMFNFTHLEAINYYNNPNYYLFYKDPKVSIMNTTYLMLVNKCYYLDKDYIPTTLVEVKNYGFDYIKREYEEIQIAKEAAEKYKLMFNSAKDNNIDLVLFSGYRSYHKQEVLFYFVHNQDDTISARPGFSEHQTGLALDISTLHDGLTEYFAESDSYKWLIDNCYKYGFILRFPRGKEKITGYDFEPWHFRYVGDAAVKIMEQGLTLEEYLFKNYELI